MPNFSTEVAHPLGREQATERLKDFLSRLVDQYKNQVSRLEGEWDENILTFSLTTYGFLIQGTLTVEDAVARLHGQLPFAAMAFRGKIEQSIARELERELLRPED